MATYPPLTLDSDYAGIPGTYPTANVRAAEAAVRKYCGWHIAPQVTETVTVEAQSPWRLLLPSLRVVSVASVTDENGTAVTGFKLRAPGEIIAPSNARFTEGLTYTVTMTHGYDSADELIFAIAQRCQWALADPTLSQRSETVGQRTSSESYNDRTSEWDPTVEAYRLHKFS